MTDEKITLGEESPEENLSEILAVRRRKLADLQAAGKDPYQIVKYDVTAKIAQIREDFAAFEPNITEENAHSMTVSVAGRMMSRRDMGKANFIDLADSTGRMQVYVRIDEIGEDDFAEFKKWDIGDIIGIEGFVFRTRRGEISIHAKKLKLLSKSLLPLPEKFHGLKDTDLRYRQRYVDLIVNPEVKDTFIKRSQIFRELRAFLDGHGFLEVDTPVLLPLEIGAAARPFKTFHNALGIDMYLRIETELYLKPLNAYSSSAKTLYCWELMKDYVCMMHKKKSSHRFLPQTIAIFTCQTWPKTEQKFL